VDTARDTQVMHDIGEVRIRPVPNGSDGLVAFASCRYHQIVLNDIAVRKDASGRLFLTFPRKVGSTGRPHPLHHPIDRETAAQFEAAILGQLRRLVGGEGGAEPR
jgi:DNA-binding cell septation regulator SpoVG